MDLRQSIAAQNDVTSTIAKHLLSRTAQHDNLVCSPLSVHVVLSLIAAGSKGRTLDQLLSFLKAQSTENLNSLSSQLVALVFADASPAGGPKLSFVNGVWIDRSLPLKPSFKQVVDNVYKAASSHVDFQTKAVEVTNEVNIWAEKETYGLVKEILPSSAVDASTRLIFANALYFKGAWNEKFDSSSTKDHDFHLLNGTSVRAPFMTSKKKQFVTAFDGFKVLGLPYKQGEDKRGFSLYFFLPDAKDGLLALVEKVGSEPGFFERHIPNQQVEMGEFQIPKFKISYGFEASEVLKELGLVLPFSGEEGLTEMVDSPAGQNLYVSSIFHKSFIEVNEEGTEAAAASAGVIKLRSLQFSDKMDFVADHPFLFLIRENMTGVVLFIGQDFYSCHVTSTIAKHLLSRKAQHANVVCSPLSVHVILSLIAAGSKGRTLDQLLSFLKAQSTENLNSFVVPARGACLCRRKPSRWPEVVAVEVTNEVNLWAEKMTYGLVKEILPSCAVDASTRLVFANALYFKGAWNEKFDSSSTKDHDFHLLNGTSVRAPFMTSKKKQFVTAFDGFKVLGLPYEQGEDKHGFSFYFFLPDAKDGLLALVEKVGSEPGFLVSHPKLKSGDGGVPDPKI
ncbi:hypothetical protein RJ639_044565 [Escallonia herrerae]|uniref:Serpin domain-containing protein n=1 Tax=Escallonia herrerae TaxID=1293975 RepID=A0AA89B526_9ASTE|nr:hypothetical protein RJ639_044565 [Escallonia herrerae]